MRDKANQAPGGAGRSQAHFEDEDEDEDDGESQGRLDPNGLHEVCLEVRDEVKAELVIGTGSR